VIFNFCLFAIPFSESKRIRPFGNPVLSIM
jgi:hypothetical protein